MSLLLNGGLLLGWGLSLALAMGNPGPQQPWELLLLVLVRTQLQTGLFIVGHDAMHGLLFPASRRVNDAIGGLALLLYAGLSFPECRRQHHLHHSQPASAHDPDVPLHRRGGAFGWYRQFLTRYLSPAQMARLLAGWGLLFTMEAGALPLPLAAARVLLFATLPLLLSSLQLFVFGTYLPHRGQLPPAHSPHPISLNLPTWVSLLACFHFGYHREHHDHPGLRWFELPGARGRPSPSVASAAAVCSR